jgi:hypothetical protein
VLSDRVSEDLDKALEYGESFFTAKVVLREWIDEVPEHPEMEFRGYVPVPPPALLFIPPPLLLLPPSLRSLLSSTVNRFFAAKVVLREGSLSYL